MNSSGKSKNILVVSLAVLFVFAVSVLAAGDKKPSAPSKPAAAPHSAPAQHSGGGQPGGGNRGPGGGMNNNNRGPGGGMNNNNRGPGGNNSMNRGQGNQTGNRGNMNNNNNRGNMGGNNNANRGNQGNRGGMNNNNRGNMGGNNNANRGNAGNRGGNQAAGNHAPKGSNTHTTRTGNRVQTRANGSVRSISGHGVTVNRGVNGHRRVVATHNGRTVVAVGRHGGYSQRAYYRHNGHEYVQRTYWRGGRAYAYGYRGYYYGGRPYYGYAPAYYWGPAYYGWAYNPWPAPVYYGWGWGGAPWYGYYGPYWSPYPAYPSAAFWLTDFFVAATLQAAYAAQAEAAAENGENITPPQFNQESSDVIAALSTSDPLVAANLSSIYGPNAMLLAGAAAAPSSSGPAMTKEIKDALAEEIKGQIAAEKTAAASKDSAGNDNGPPAALDPNIRYFVVANDEDLTTSDGTECTLTGGDVLYRTGDQPDDDQMVNATVKASRKGECAVGETVGVPTDDLMDMYNGMRENMSDGMKEMAKNSGKNGLPTAPDTTTTAGEVPQPTADSNVQGDLNQAQKDADAAEADAKQSN